MQLFSTWKCLARLAAALLAVPASSMAASAVGSKATLQAIVDAAIRPIMQKDKVPGIAVAVTANGKAAFFNYGVASRETQEPVGEATIFELGSVSKTFTATLALYSHELGRLSLTDHPSKYIPVLRGAAVDKATLLNLGTYTAGGLPLQFPEEVSDDESMVRYFRTWKPDAEPDVQRRYSNPSIGLLGRIASLSLQSSFAHALETDLLPKLGLEHTYIQVPPSMTAHYAWGYDERGKPVRVNPGELDAETYGVKSTAADMIRFVQINIDPSPLPQPLRNAVAGTQRGYFEVGAMVQGLGWEQYPFPVSRDDLLQGNSTDILFNSNPVKAVVGRPAGPRLFNKTGSTGGFGAYVVFVPDEHIGVVILANRDYPIADRVRAGYAILTALATVEHPALWIYPHVGQHGELADQLLEHPESWKETRSVIRGMGFADHVLNRNLTDPQLKALFAFLRQEQIELDLEVGAVKPWGVTGEDTFRKERKMWDRFIADGAEIHGIAMDEPVTATLNALHKPLSYAVEETARFVALVRENYPRFVVGDIEGHPWSDKERLLTFWDGLNARLEERGIRRIDYVRLDVDWMHFVHHTAQGRLGWQGVREIEIECHKRHLPFSLIYWAANYGELNRAHQLSDLTWDRAILEQARWYSAIHGSPDQYVIENWVPIPADNLPETKPGTFMQSVLDFHTHVLAGHRRSEP